MNLGSRLLAKHGVVNGLALVTTFPDFILVNLATSITKKPRKFLMVEISAGFNVMSTNPRFLFDASMILDSF